MKGFDYQAFYDRIGAENGWDFSRIQCEVEGEGLDLFRRMAETAHGSEILLDIGTGGGEALMSVSDAVLLAVGIDNSHSMLSTARRNLVRRGQPNVRFLPMDAQHLDFPDDFFDIATCRHSDFAASEVFRTLGPGGVFFTQQVSEDDKLNIKQFFGRGQAFGLPTGTLEEQCLEALAAAGFRQIESCESDVTEYYSRPEDLVFLLKHTPILPHFGEEVGDFKKLDAFIQTHTTNRGIVTNASRFMIVAHK